MKTNRAVTAVIAASLLCAGFTTVMGGPASAETATATFTADGTFVVPDGTTSIDVVLVGGSGGTCDYGDFGITHGGLGARVSTTLEVVPGSTLQIRVGGQGTCNVTMVGGEGGANGGGNPGGAQGGGGGGASDIRVESGLDDRIAVAGGGGGGSWIQNQGLEGGAGGTPNGGDPEALDHPAGGGTQSDGGAAGGTGILLANPGYFGVGGDGYGHRGGGGGGGYYGGGGGSTGFTQGGGGGGSSWVDGSLASATSYSLAAQEGPGSVVITYDGPATTTTTTTTTTTPGTGSSGAARAGFGSEQSASTTAVAGGTVDVTGSGWELGSEVTATLHSNPVELGRVTASDSGAISASFTIPSTVSPGSHSLVLTGTDIDGQPATVTLEVTVTAAGTGAGSPAAGQPAPLSFAG